VTRTFPARALTTAVTLAAAASLGACEKPQFVPPSREERVAQADSIFTPALFDTIAWTSDSARAFDGNNTFAAHCRNCHGYLGQGDTEYARQYGIAVPSLVRADWPYDDVQAVRRRIFTGHPAGMPTWGVAGITAREIDAVAYYIVHVLRPEVR
jgi:mono/diheme cytochrome c family protein